MRGEHLVEEWEEKIRGAVEKCCGREGVREKGTS